MKSLKRDWTLLLAMLALSTAVVQAEVRTWTKVNGERIQAELVGQTKVAVKLRTPDGGTEIWSKDRLSEDDRVFIGLPPAGGDSGGASSGSGLAAAGGSTSVATSKVPELTNASNTAPASAGSASASAASAANESEPVNAPLTKKIASSLVELKGNKFVALPASRTANVKYYAFYFSAGWCPPCHRFTPELVKAYGKLKAKHPELEIVLVSSDESEGAMRDYMKEFSMPFPAVRFDDIKKTLAIQAYRENGIPNLVFVDGAGRLISASYVKGEYMGPQKVLTDIFAKLD